MHSLAYIPLPWKVLRAIVIGILLAKWFWILVAPQVTFTAMSPTHLNPLDADKLFGVAASTGGPTQNTTLLNVKLLGVFTASTRMTGFAILKLDDKRQTGVAEGSDVIPGTKLSSVHTDYVLLERNGLQQKVMLENKFAAALNNKSVVQTPNNTSGVMQNR